MLSRDISYKDYNRRNDIHGTVLYPAVMIAPVQKEILSDLIDPQKHTRIIDPFHGSGTALYEAAELSDNAVIYGCDINPLANLITRVKLQGVSENIETDINNLVAELSRQEPVEAFEFTKIKKWFKDDIISDLTKARQAIQKIPDTKNRLFFWYMLIDIIRRYSNTRTSTYKLHVKDSEHIDRLENNLLRDYLEAVKENYHWFRKEHKNIFLHKGDTLTFLQNIEDNEFDICVTSPPYGDNATTVPYGQFSMLALRWIDPKDLEFEGWELNNYAIIDSKSLGGPFQSVEDDETAINLRLQSILTDIDEGKQRKVIRFFSGYYSFLDQIARVTQKHIIITLGNRTVDGVNINLTDLTIEYLKAQGFIERELSKREILSKRIPSRVSSVNSKPVSSMNEEYVVVMEKTI